MAEDLDPVARYAQALGLRVRRRTLLLEGTTDVDLLGQAAACEYKQSGIQLLDGDFAVCAAGRGDHGGASGLVRELIALRGIARTQLLPNGTPQYRFIGLLDNDLAGQRAARMARELDSSILEYKDVFRLWPVMPVPGNLDPGTVRNTFERANATFRPIHWELEDALAPEFVSAFLGEYPRAVARRVRCGDWIHTEYTADGKAQLHKFTKLHAKHEDLSALIGVLRAIRAYFNLPRR